MGKRCESAYDIVSSLPLELLLEIVEYLEPADIVRSRRVSKRWQSVFSSDTITTFLVRRTLAFLDIERANVAAPEATTYFRWQHGLQYARPVKKIFLPWSQTPRMPMNATYHSRRICYSYRMGSTTFVEILNLETGEKSTWTEDEELMHSYWNLLLSDRHVVIFKAPRCALAWDTHTLQKHARELPCAFQHASLEKDKLIMVDSQSKPLCTVYIWDLSSGRFRKIGSFPDLCLWHVNVDEDILVAFQIDWDTHPPEVQETKWTLTGRLLDRRHFRLSLSDRCVDRKIPKLSKRSIDIPFYDCRTFGHKTVRNLDYRDSQRHKINLMYDFATDKLSAQWYDLVPPAFDYFNYFSVTVLTSRILYFWYKNTELNLFDAENRTIFVRPYQLHTREINFRKFLWPSQRGRHGATTDDERRPFLIFGDREVFCVATEDGIQLWFFNPKFTPDLPDAEPFLPSQESG